MSAISFTETANVNTQTPKAKHVYTAMSVYRIKLKWDKASILHKKGYLEIYMTVYHSNTTLCTAHHKNNEKKYNLACDEVQILTLANSKSQILNSSTFNGFSTVFNG